MFANNEARHNGTPYRSIFVNHILLDSQFRKEYTYDLVISPFSIGEKQQGNSRIYRPPDFRLSNLQVHNGGPTRDKIAMLTACVFNDWPKVLEIHWMFGQIPKSENLLQTSLVKTAGLRLIILSFKCLLSFQYIPR
jgi:hypothetical protein